MADSDGFVSYSPSFAPGKSFFHARLDSGCHGGAMYWLVEVDERSNRVLRRVPVSLNAPDEMTVAYGSVWAPLWNFRKQANVLLQVSNTRGGAPRSLPGIGGPMSAGSGYVWAE